VFASKHNSEQRRSSSHAVDDAVRELLLLMPRLVGRAKRLGVPDALRGLDLAPRHLSLLSYLLFDGPLTVSQLAQRLEVAPTTVSLLVSELAAKGVVEREQDAADRRRHIVDIAHAQRAAIEAWLAPGAAAWRVALEPLTSAERTTFVATLRAYEHAVTSSDGL
jgi:DNA-binding MarR family transcriptional regulator